MWKARKAIAVALLALVFVAVSGCDKVTQKNYDKVQPGMTVSEVEKVLGPGKEKVGAAGAVGDVGGSVKVMTWGDENRSVTVTFVNDKVVAKVAHGL